MVVFETPLGNMLAKANDVAIRLLEFTDKKWSIATNSTLLLRLESEIREYFEGKRGEFSLPLAPVGTPFQMSVWHTLQKIPYGETVSYAAEAQMLGRASAVRAVANANGCNPISILIPCHRAIRGDGGIGGYRGGAWRKEFLLNLESTSDYALRLRPPPISAPL